MILHLQAPRGRNLHRREVEASEEGVRRQLPGLLHLLAVLLTLPGQHLLPAG